MTRVQWSQISIRLPPEFQDLLVGQLVPLGFVGFEQKDSRLECFIEHTKLNPMRRKLFEQTLARFQEQFPTLNLRHTSSVIQDRNWNAAWEKTAGIVDATPTIVIKPSWKKLRARDRGKIVLHIDPKMSFGTGHHETTRLALLLLEKYLKRGNTMLDFGCGTGVLAIAGVKLGASHATAVDLDGWSIANTKENVRRNRCEMEITILKGSLNLIRPKKFDMVAANIDLPTISVILGGLSTRLSHDGVLVLSGLLVTDVDQLYPFLRRRNLVPLEIVEESEWVALALRRV